MSKKTKYRKEIWEEGGVEFTIVVDKRPDGTELEYKPEYRVCPDCHRSFPYEDGDYLI